MMNPLYRIGGTLAAIAIAGLPLGAGAVDPFEINVLLPPDFLNCDARNASRQS